MDTCTNCQKTYTRSASEFYKDTINILDSLCSFPSEILDIILEYGVVSRVKLLWIVKREIECNCSGCRYDRTPNDAVHMNRVIVYECKRRHEMSKTICSRCFVEGVERCPARLPYMNRHIEYCFMARTSVIANPYKYIIPPYYCLYFYRSSTPLENDGKLIISCQ